MKQKYVKIKGKWHMTNSIKSPIHEVNYFTDNEAMLLNLGEETMKVLLKRNNRKALPILLMFDGVDGAGKTTIVENIIKKLKESNVKVIFNTFKRRRNDNPLFEEPTIKYEWMFRKEVVEQINRRLVEYTDEDIIIVDKSPYCEYFYQKTGCFDRGTIKPQGNFKMDQEIFKYKDIIDNAIVIFLENDDCWNNYYKRETKKDNGGHKSSYTTLNEDQYMEMVRMFKRYQSIYESRKKYKAIKIQNNQTSWKIVYNNVLRIMKDGQ